MDKFEPTLWHKDEALGHFFFYRVRQLLHASRLVSTPLPDDASLDDKIRYNALVESFLIHSRALYEFLTNGKEPQNRKEKDVLIKDYGLKNSYNVVIRSGYKDKLDKDLAHFTYSENITKEQKEWRHEELVYPILLAAKKFIECMLQEYSFTTDKAPLFRERLEQLLEQIDEYLKTAP